MRLPFAAVLLAAPLVVGCASSENVVRLSDAVYAPLPEGASVQVTTGDLDGPYEELAIVVAGAEPGTLWPRSEADEIEVMNLRLREAAREVGAQAVVRVRYEITAEHPRATGTAVRLLTP